MLQSFLTTTAAVCALFLSSTSASPIATLNATNTRKLLSMQQESLPADLDAVAMQAYDYGYPLMLEVTTSLGFFLSEPNMTFNTFIHRRNFPPPEDKAVIHYNLDTMYSTAFLDMSQGPLELSIPNTKKDQYWLMQVMDAWTNVIGNPGTRTTGNKKQKHLLVGPKGIPAGLNTKKYDSVIKSPTNLMWIIGRTLVRNGNFEEVWPIQDQYKLTPVESKDKPKKSSFEEFILPETAEAESLVETTSNPFEPIISGFAKGLTPPAVVANLSGEQFFTIASILMCENPALLPQDEPALALYQHIGFKPCQPFVPASVAAKHAVAKTPAASVPRYSQMTSELGVLVDGWRIILEDIGRYGTNYPIRAVIAFSFIGANLPEDAVYPETHLDFNGDYLKGEKAYTITFNANALPPVDAFWSITMYDEEGYFLINPDAPVQKFALSSASSQPPVVKSQDGSIKLYFQASIPKDEKLAANWIPTKAGEKFRLNMRLYSPKQDVLSLKWTPPAVQITSTPV